MSTADTIYRLKVTLAETDPVVWRVVEVADSSLHMLHRILQVSMGWNNEHPWFFYIEGKEYGDDRNANLSEFVKLAVTEFRYTYNEWEQVVQVESIRPADPQAKYPRCIDGGRAYPPEGCSGPWGYPLGYSDFLEGIQSPDHEYHKDLLEWVGGEFDPEAFDVEAVNKNLAMMR